MDNQNLHEVGCQRLNFALQKCGMNAAELARKTDLAKSTISRYLKGQSIPKQPQVLLMAKALDVNPTWLMGYDAPIDGLDYALLDDKNQVFAILESMNVDQRKQLIKYAEFLLRGEN